MPIDPNAVTPFQWALNHVQLIGWPTVCIAIYKLSRFLIKVSDRALKVEDQITLMSGNHFPHMQASLERLVELAEAQDARWQQWMLVQAAQHHKE